MPTAATQTSRTAKRISAPPEPATSRLDGALAIFAAALPFLVTVARASSGGQWRSDLPAVRDLGLVAVGIGGGVSTVVTQAMSLLPLGSRAFRAALGSALALGVAAYLLYGIALRVLRAVRPSRRMPPVLAAIATLVAALSPTWQGEGTLGGGAMIATALALGAVTLASRSLARKTPGVARGNAPGWIALAAVLGALLAESPPAFVAAAAAIAALVAVERLEPRARVSHAWPTERTVRWSAGALVATAAVLLAPHLLRPMAPRAWVDLGRALSAASLSGLDVAATHTTALDAYLREVGLVSLVVAAVGVAFAVLRRAGRLALAPLFAFVVADLVVPASLGGVLDADPLTALRALALGSIAVASALGVHAAIAALLSSRLPFARPAAVLIVVFDLTLVAVASEDAGFVADRSEQMAAEEWSDLALGALEPRSAILVRSPVLAFRLWATRLTRGERPDVLVIPVPLLRRGRLATSLADAEPAVRPLLRDYELTGEPTEFSLSTLADMRPLHVELDGPWPKRLEGHLNVDGLWLEYAPQPLGASDRKQATAATLAPIRRVLAAITAGVVPDTSTSSVLAGTLRMQAAVLAQLGDREGAKAFVDRVAELAPSDPFMGGGFLRAALAGIAPLGNSKPTGRAAAQRGAAARKR